MRLQGLAAALALMFGLLSGSVHAQVGGGKEALAILRILDVKPGGGRLLVAFYNSSESYKAERPFRTLSLEPAGASVSSPVSLPPGDYLISIFQDRSGNGALDTNFLGIPREPVGISNYDGKGRPGGFDRHKIAFAQGGEFEVKLVEILP